MRCDQTQKRIIMSENLHIAQYVEGRGLVRVFGVYCQVQGFRYSTKAIRRQGRTSRWTSAEIGTVPQGVRFRSSLHSSFLLRYPELIILHEIAWKRRNSRRRSLSLFRNVS